jgi:hypothetical protein
VFIDRCPLCEGRNAVQESIPGPNLYSEKLALALGRNEDELLTAHANWRCKNCGLIFKRWWFGESVVKDLFTGSVAVHPRGWDALGGRFSPAGFRGAVELWSDGIEHAVPPDIRRGERELRSIIESITEPSYFDRTKSLAAIAGGDVSCLRDMSDMIVKSIGEPAPFKRFSGFRAESLWEYLQSQTGGFLSYAEVGCPLWGLLSMAAQSCSRATFLLREESNYWGDGCINSGVRCTARLLGDRRIDSASWAEADRYPVIGLFQYLDHLTNPRRFLSELFDRAASAVIILDDLAAPPAIQHVTGWTEASLAYAGRLYDKRLHTDFDAIRPSGNVLYLFTD